MSAVNARDVTTATDLLSEDCRMVDSSGDWIEGRAEIGRVMQRFMEIEPDFRITIDDISRRGHDLLLRGHAQARDPQIAKDTLWMARTEGGLISHWQSYGPSQRNHVMRALMPDEVHCEPIEHATRKEQSGPLVHQRS
ncbi:nuclear transport factor 2 family protein [Altererythrobacter sp. HHU K3-1]|uniref:Nuclear transport factor 2 family protein n=1 Tax=Qipengyuania atrilutea TaxID=2744473 RepID=A0A850GVS2_9SPHN|nr:nuclear transport factor 2 family protein [Actirhodobacter atriluteus]